MRESLRQFGRPMKRLVISNLHMRSETRLNGSIQNAAGRFIKATVESTSAAAASQKELPTDLRVSISDATGAESYPVASFSWVLVPANLRGTPKGKTLADFLSWIVGGGQKFAADLFYAPLPGRVALQARKAIEQEK